MPNIRLMRHVLALAAGVSLIASCGTVAPTIGSSEVATEPAFQTQFYGGLGYGTLGYGGLGYNDFGYGLGGYGGYGLGNYGLGGYGGWGHGGYGGYGGYGSWGGLGMPMGGDYYGGQTFLTPSGRIDRQPRTLPPGIAEENDEAYRPVGSAIWQRK